MLTASLNQKKALVFLTQPIDDPDKCLDIAKIRDLSAQARKNPALFSDNGNNFLDADEDRDRFFKNCAKLSGERTPFFDGGLLQAGTLGTHRYFSTRNSCFSNRDQKGILNILAPGQINADGTINNVDTVAIGAGVGGSLAAVVAFAGLVVMRRRQSGRVYEGSNGSGGLKAFIPGSPAETFSNIRSSFAQFGSSMRGFGGSFRGFGGGGGLDTTGNNGGFNQFQSPVSNQGNGMSRGIWGQSFAQQPQQWVSSFKSGVQSMRGGFGNTFGGGPSGNPVFGNEFNRSAANPGFSPSGNAMAAAGMAGGVAMGMGMQSYGGNSRSGASPMPSARSAPPTRSMSPGGTMMSQASGRGGGNNNSKARAMYDHEASEQGELSFRKGEIVNILRRDASGWWEGECNGMTGIFPANYVRVLSSGWQ
jgi:hypothetical protein